MKTRIAILLILILFILGINNQVLIKNTFLEIIKEPQEVTEIKNQLLPIADKYDNLTNLQDLSNLSKSNNSVGIDKSYIEQKIAESKARLASTNEKLNK